MLAPNISAVFLLNDLRDLFYYIQRCYRFVRRNSPSASPFERAFVYKFGDFDPYAFPTVSYRLTVWRVVPGPRD